MPRIPFEAYHVFQAFVCVESVEKKYGKGVQIVFLYWGKETIVELCLDEIGVGDIPFENLKPGEILDIMLQVKIPGLYKVKGEWAQFHLGNFSFFN